jgi:thiol:disulfide interchange protein
MMQIIILYWYIVFSALAEENPFRLEIVPPQGEEQSISFVVVVPEQHHIYREMLDIKVLESNGIDIHKVDFPQGEWMADPAAPESFREIYHETPIIPVTYGGELGTHDVRFEVTYQGCREGLCYPPVIEEHSIKLEVHSNENGPQLHSSVYPTVDFSNIPETAVARKKDSKGNDHPVVARLMIDREYVVPGQPFRVGVHLTQEEGWHTYWKSPGDIGLTTSITWTLPEGFNAAEYQYPIPHRYEDSGIVSYGYDGQVMYFSEVDVPLDVPEGEIELSANVRWLVCKKQCIPGGGSITLPVQVKSGESVSNQYTPLFESFENQHPESAISVEEFSIETALSTSAVQSESKFKFAIYLNPMGPEGDMIESVQDIGTWPFFTPIVNGQYFITDTTIESMTDGGVRIMVDAETYELDDVPSDESIGALLQIKDGDNWIRTEVEIPLPWASKSETPTQSNSPLFAAINDLGQPTVEAKAALDTAPTLPVQNFWFMLLAAFIGGFILNAMPCVLPVLTIKLYSLIEKQGTSASSQMKSGLVYSLGVICSFWFLALCIILLRTVMEIPVGWGFQFQYPEFVIPLATVVFVFGLSLFGVFEVPAFGANSASEISNKDGVAGYFLTGVFTTLLATPCSAPFLGTGMGFAFSLPVSGLVLFFTVAGLGLASPFLVIAFFPSLLRFFPKPGMWMNTFKIVMGFTLIATTVWLADVVGGLLGREGVTGFLFFLTVVAFACWVQGEYGNELESKKRQLSIFVFNIVLSFVGGYYLLNFDIPEAQANTGGVQVEGLNFDEEIPWQPFSDAAVNELDGRTIFIDFTADWCLSCKVNEKTILSTEQVRNAMSEHNVVPIKADWTRRDAEITTWLERYGRAGVPFYIVIPGNGEAPIPLGELITPSSVVEAIIKGSE